MKKALLIGINYDSIPNIKLNGCIDDIVNMRNMLIDAYGYIESNIIMLRDDGVNDINGGNSEPTCNNIIKQLESLADVSGDLDEILIYYSGHGSQIIVSAKSDDVIMPIDYKINGVITGNQMHDIIKTIKCTAIILFDSCHSGTICSLPWLFESKNAGVKINDNTITNPNIYIMSGCKDSQTCADSYNNRLHEYVGVFSSSFIDCLQKSQHQILILDLYRNVCANILLAGYAQVPLLTTTTNNPTYMFDKNSMCPVPSLAHKNDTKQ
jgi:hypothetical protein